MISYLHTKRGFTLIEMIVSIGLFTIVLFIASSAFLSVVNADRKSRATRLTMDNLTVAMEDMTRRMKTGFAYMCEGTIESTTTDVRDCLTPSTSVVFTDQEGKRTGYSLSGGRIVRQIESSGPTLFVTAPEIIISSLTFDVQGTDSSDNIQPYIRIFIDGTTGGGVTDSRFNLQTMVTQRSYDI